jgi:surface antigen
MMLVLNHPTGAVWPPYDSGRTTLASAAGNTELASAYSSMQKEVYENKKAVISRWMEYWYECTQYLAMIACSSI